MTDEKHIILENENLSVTFDCRTGALIGLVLKSTGWAVHRRPKLGGTFRMLVPLPERRNNRVIGELQKNTRCERASDGESVTFVWDGVESEHGASLDITVRLISELTDDGLAFSGSVDNRSPYTVEYIIYPYIGDVSMPPGESMLKRHCVGYCGASTSSLLPVFAGNKSYFSIDNPMVVADFPSTPFALVASENQGVYAGCHDISAKNSVWFVNEVRPGVLEGVTSGRVPSGDEISGLPVHLEFYTAQFVFATPGESSALSPIVLKPYVGTWYTGVDI